jgi:hypothetical protein
MKYLLFLIAVAASFNIVAQSLEKDFTESFSVKVSNPLKTARENILIVLSADQLKKASSKFNSNAFVVFDGSKEIPSQFNSKDKDDAGVVFVIDKLAASESKNVEVRFNSSGSNKRSYPKLTQAELSHKTGGSWENREYIAGAFQNVEYLRVPPEHKDHSWFIRYEGPGWESDKVGYRFYLDQRNATDVFGKKTHENVLQQVVLDGFDSYHNPQPWGMDVMKVGKSLGIGSIGAVLDGKAIRVEKTDSVNCRIVENGVIFSSILTNYKGWQIGEKKHDVKSRLSIHAGTRLTHERIDVTNNPVHIATGIVKDKLGKFIADKGDATRWAYIATYGKQSLNSDELGLVVFYKPSSAIDLTEDEFSHIVTLKPEQGKVDYYFGAAWVGEPDGIKDENEFVRYIEQAARELAAPVKVEIVSRKK